MIRLRSEPARGPDAVEWLRQEARGLAGKDHLISARVFTRVGVSGDIGIHLEWDAPFALMTGSEAGLGISHALSGLGLVDHSVWIESSEELAEAEGTQPAAAQKVERIIKGADRGEEAARRETANHSRRSV